MRCRGHRVDLEATISSLGSGEGTRVSARFVLAATSSARILVPEMWELCSRAASVFFNFDDPVNAAMDFEPPRPEGFESVVLVSLSTLKACIDIRRTMASHLSVFDRVRLSFELPEYGAAVDVGGSITELAVLNDTYLRGTVSFETATSDYDVASHKLSSFLRQRHDEALASEHED